jgi:hypothetical protein
MGPIHCPKISVANQPLLRKSQNSKVESSINPCPTDVHLQAAWPCTTPHSSQHRKLNTSELIHPWYLVLINSRQKAQIISLNLLFYQFWLFRLLEEPSEASNKINKYVKWNFIIRNTRFFYIYSVTVYTVELTDILFTLLWGLPRIYFKKIPFTHGATGNNFITLTQYAFIAI